MAKKTIKLITMRFRVSPSERLRIERNARASKLETSSYLRFLGLQGLKVLVETEERIQIKAGTMEEVDLEIKEKENAG